MKTARWLGLLRKAVGRVRMPLMALGIFTGLGWAHFRAVSRDTARVRPPVGANLLVYPPSADVSSVWRSGVGGRGYFYVARKGTDSSVLALRSGVAAYVFDSAGHLADWAEDTGDNARFEQRWNDVRKNGEGIPLGTARLWALGRRAWEAGR